MLTGADGFIGSHLAEELVRRNFAVRAFVHYNSIGSRGWLDAAPEIRKELDIFAGDMCDPNGVRTAMKGCDVVLHLAALIAIPYSYHSPDTYVETNIRGTLNVVQAARDLGVEQVGPYLDQRGLRHGAIRSDHRGPSPAGAVALFREQDRRRPDGVVIPSLVRHAGDRGAAV